jgi:D-beta-D-heptose 7-phosphate kinase/D-beta-D-heptose 1-phosphate adenosyltransferase
MKIWTNGCFDILHRGHVELFKYARSLGDELIVGIDSDEKVKNDKGNNRPFNSLHDRIEMLNAIVYVDKVIPFDTTNELERLVKWLKPHVMVIGSDWKGKEVIGQKYTEKVVFFDRIGNYSTTKILENK